MIGEIESTPREDEQIQRRFNLDNSHIPSEIPDEREITISSSFDSDQKQLFQQDQDSSYSSYEKEDSSLRVFEAHQQNEFDYHSFSKVDISNSNCLSTMRDVTDGNQDYKAKPLDRRASRYNDKENFATGNISYISNEDPEEIRRSPQKQTQKSKMLPQGAFSKSPYTNDSPICARPSNSYAGRYIKMKQVQEVSGGKKNRSSSKNNQINDYSPTGGLFTQIKIQAVQRVQAMNK